MADRMKITVEGRDGQTADIDAEPCTFCDGVGTMREPKKYRTRGIDDDEYETRTVIMGEQCPMCVGRGLVGIVGGGDA